VFKCMSSSEAALAVLLGVLYEPKTPLNPQPAARHNPPPIQSASIGILCKAALGIGAIHSR